MLNEYKGPRGRVGDVLREGMHSFEGAEWGGMAWEEGEGGKSA